MASRLNIIRQAIAGDKKSRIGDLNKIKDSCFDYLELSDYLSADQNKVRLKVRQLVDKQFGSKIVPYIEKAQFPQYLLPHFKSLQLAKYFFPKPYGFGSRTILQGVLLLQLARGDCGMATLMIVTRLLGFTLMNFGTKEQQEKYLPKLASMEITGAWALTQVQRGSDASHIETKATKTEKGGYVLNGVKNWIGNGTGDVICLWALNTQNNKIQPFIVQPAKLSGFSSEPIKQKMALRTISHCKLTLDNVQVDESQRMPGIKSFQEGTSKALMSSRVAVLWTATGLCVGCYESAVKYATGRQQFGRSISGFQMIQQKLVKMMSTIQAMLLLCFQITSLFDQNQSNIGMISLAKAWITQRGREVTRLGRQICGGNGLLSENYVIRAVADLEATYTYEGTYEVNTLIAGRQITGIAAFK